MGFSDLLYSDDQTNIYTNTCSISANSAYIMYHERVQDHRPISGSKYIRAVGLAKSGIRGF